MKQILALILCAAIALSLLGCARPVLEETVPTVPETQPETLPAAPIQTLEEQTIDAYQAVVNGEEPFIDIYYGAPLTVQNGRITDNDGRTTEAIRFTLVDLDQNGAQELILWLREGQDDQAGFWLMWFAGDRVWGQNLTYRSFDQLKQDGTFLLSGRPSDSAYCDGIGQMKLTQDGWFSEYSASHVTEYDADFNVASEQWFLGEEPAESGDYLNYYMVQADKPIAVWSLFTKANLAKAGIGEYEAEVLSSEEIEGKFIDILAADGVFYSRWDQREFSLEENREAAVMQTGLPVVIDRVAAVDMDGDGTKELLVQQIVGEAGDGGIWVLHYQNGEVQGQHYYIRQLGRVKQDGSFWWSGSASDNGAARLVFGDGEWTYQEVPREGFDDKEDIAWVPYPRDDYSELFL